MDFTPIKRAGLKQIEFAALVGVSRPTVNLWVRGKMHPNRYIQKHVKDTLAAVQAAVKNGDLPLPAHLGPDYRTAAIGEAVSKHQSP